MIFGYPPMIFQESDYARDSYSGERQLKSHVEGLWNMLGKHIYGNQQVDHKEGNQLRQMIEKHHEMEVLERVVEESFMRGIKLQSQVTVS